MRLILALFFIITATVICEDETTIKIYQKCESDSTLSKSSIKDLDNVLSQSSVKETNTVSTNMYKEPFTNMAIKFRERGVILDLKNKIIFTDEDTVINNIKGSLDEVIIYLKTYPTIRLIVEGHTSSIGSKKLNYKLSMKRSVNVVGYLVSQGIEKDRLLEKYLGSTFLEYGDYRDGRVEFVIIQNDNDFKKYETSVYPY